MGNTHDEKPRKKMLDLYSWSKKTTKEVK